jgi:hypothetical protein
MYQFDAHPIADLETFVATLQTSFDERTPDSNPRPFFRRAGHEGVETLADA